MECVERVDLINAGGQQWKLQPDRIEDAGYLYAIWYLDNRHI